jgi:hypothetical protein
VNKVILNWQRPLWEGDQEVVKRSARDEPMCVAIHMCMEPTLGISPFYPSLSQTSKKDTSFSLSPVFSLTKSENKRVDQVLPRSGVGGERGVVAG